MISRFLCCFLLVVAIHSDQANSQISGFSDFSENWTYHQLDSGSLAAIDDDFIVITNDVAQARNIWFNTTQPIDSFTTSFRYQTSPFGNIEGGGPFNVRGISFIIQNSMLGVDAETTQNLGAGFTGIDQGVAVVFNLLNVGKVEVSFLESGPVQTGGTELGDRTTFDDGLDVLIIYDGSTLNFTIDDGIETPFTQTLIIKDPISDLLNSSSAFIGFGASTGGSFLGPSQQTISNFQFKGAGSFLIGDINGDGNIDLLDVAPFVGLLTNGGFQDEADINQDGVVDLLDVAPFVDLLASG